MRNSTPFLLLLVLLSLTGCEDDVNCVEMAGHPDCLPSCLEDPTLPGCDAFDLGTDDQGVPEDAGPCGMCASGTVCDPAAATCVACLGDGDCTDEVCLVDAADSTNNECVGCVDSDDCSGDTGTCDTDSNECVGCLMDSDCTDPAMAKCDTGTNTCVECDSSTQCAGTGENECVAGACVECTEGTAEDDCGDFSCNPATNECTETERGSVTRCGACVSDTDCGLDDDRCVAMDFMGAARDGGYCLKRGSTGCLPPYTSPTEERASLSGAAPEQYCGIREDLTTCEAVRDLVDGSSCDMDTECGAEGLTDGRCETVNLTTNRCTYDCGGTDECRSGTICGTNGMYCGAPAT